MQIHIPEDLGGDLRVLPEDTYDAQIQDLFTGSSKAGNPKITVKWVVTSEYSGKKTKDYKPTTGENVLENFSLLPQAVWNLNSLWTEVTGEKLPHGDYSLEEFGEILKTQLIGAEFKIDVTTSTESGDERSNIVNRMKA